MALPPVHNELVFGEIAVKRGLLTQQALETALAARHAAGSSIGIGNWLVEAGHLTEVQVVAILHEQQAYERRVARERQGAAAAARPTTSAEVLVGRQVASFNLVGVIENDALGVTYRAWDRDASRPATVLVVQVPPGASDARVAAALDAIAPSTALDHGNIERVLSAERWGPRLFVAAASTAGESLAELLGRRGRIEPRFATWLISRIAIGLAHAHSHGVHHGAIELRSLIVGESGEPKLRDFGRAALRELLDRGTALPDRPATVAMAPELLTGRTWDGRADVYSLGIVFHELLAGVAPYREGRRRELVDRMKAGPPPALHGVSGVPKRLADIVARMTALRRDERFPTVGELASELQAFFREHFPRVEPIDPGAQGDAAPAATGGERWHRTMAVPAPVPPATAATRGRAPEQASAKQRESRRRIAINVCVSCELQTESPVALQQLLAAVSEAEAPAAILQVLRLLAEADRHAEAIAFATEAISFYPGHAELHEVLGLALLAEGDDQRAWAQLLRVIQIDPDRPRAWLALADAEARRGNPGRAEEAYREALRRAPDLPDAHAEYGGFLQRVREDPAKALECLRRAVELAPRRWDLRRRLAWTYFEMGDTARSLAELEKVAENAPTPEVWVLLGRIKLDGGDEAAAVGCFESAIDIDPSCDEALGGLMVAAFDRESWDEALRHAERLMVRRATDPGIRLIMGSCLFRLQRHDEAKAQLEAVLELDPGCREARQGLVAVRRALTGAAGSGSKSGVAGPDGGDDLEFRS